MTAHAILGASSAKRWMNCPGSIALGEQFPDPGSSIFAEHGSAAHALCEFCLENDEKPQDWKGHWINKAAELFKPGDDSKTDDAYIIDSEMIDGVQIYLDVVYAQMEELQALGEDPKLQIEKSFRLDFIRNDMFGTNDASVFAPQVILHVNDFKYGAGIPVEVKENEQLMYYALGAIHEACWDKKAKVYDPELLPTEVELVIIQPRAIHKDGPVRRWRTSTKNIIETFAAVLKEAADATTIPNAELRAGSWCQFCRAKAGCPEIRDSISRALETDFDEMDDDDDLEALAKSKAEDVFADPDKLAQAMKILPLLDMYAKAISGRVQAELQAGHKVPGFKLVRKKSNRKWSDVAEAEAELNLVYEENEIYKPRALQSFTQIEKLPGGKDIVKNHTFKPEGGITVTHDADPREAIITGVGDDFDDISEDE